MSEYAERDYEEIGEHYAKHIGAMTSEGLHSKAAIAEELAWRDLQIEQLQSQMVEARDKGNDLFGHLQNLANICDRLNHRHYHSKQGSYAKHIEEANQALMGVHGKPAFPTKGDREMRDYEGEFPDVAKYWSKKMTNNKEITWDGNGLPPVGETVECKATGEWFPVEIMYRLENVAVFKDLNDGFVDCKNEGSNYVFRPIQTPELAEREEMQRSVATATNDLSLENICKLLHEKGYRKLDEEVSEDEVLRNWNESDTKKLSVFIFDNFKIYRREAQE